VAAARAPEWLRVVTAAERPDLWALSAAGTLFAGVWPEYNRHGDHTGAYFGALVPTFARFQVLLVDERDAQVVARGRSIPFRWDGAPASLPAGIDALGLAALREPAAPTSLSALSAEVVPARAGQGLGRLVLRALTGVARAAGLAPLVAPVRPSAKEHHPLTPIGEYATWRRADGMPFDPWIRTHAHLGGEILRPETRSLRITAPVVDWERWTGLELPADGRFVFPRGLAPLEVRDGVGRYWEPNVWMVHPVSG
jgi:GNAT superfamily N-acetyltransferase